MKKVKKIVITSTIVVLLSSGITYSLCKKNHKDIDFINYLKEYQGKEDDLLICAHRGFSSLEIENTYQAISLASSENYIDCIEMDARMTADGKIVLSHDDIILNDKLLPIRVSDLTYDEAINMDFLYQTVTLPNYFGYDYEQIMVNNRYRSLNNKKYHLCGLSDAIKACGDKTIILELKFNNNIKEFINELKREIIDTSNIIIQSFNPVGMMYLQENSDFECMLLVDSESDFKYISNFKKLAIEKSLITYDLMKNLINNDIKVAVWTVNSSSDMKSLLERVQDYYKDIIYITNYPDLIFTRLNEKRLVKTNS